MTLIFDELVHFLLALAVGLFFYWRFRRWETIITAIIFGFLIDVDHLFDYFAFFNFQFNLSSFFATQTYFVPSGKIYVLFHAWEWLILLWLIFWQIGKRFKIKSLQWVVSGAYFFHLVWDCISTQTLPLVYLITYRLLNDFEISKIYHK